MLVAGTDNMYHLGVKLTTASERVDNNGSTSHTCRCAHDGGAV